MSDKTKPESTPPPAPLPAISIVPQPVPATTIKPQPDFKDAPPNTPQFSPVKHPLRFGIFGKQHLIAPLKAMITADDTIPDHYKAVLHAEIDAMKTNAAQVDLHIVDHADGGVSIQGHIKPIQLG